MADRLGAAAAPRALLLLDALPLLHTGKPDRRAVAERVRGLMATPSQWLAGARPKTLPAALAPVLVGTGAAAALDGFRPVPAAPRARRRPRPAGGGQLRQRLLRRQARHRRRPGGPDAARRLRRGAPAPGARRGRPRVRASPRVAGLGLAALSSWWLVAVGAVCIAAAWTYTGGPLPYGYRALGEVFVFVFFGPVAVVGTTFAQTGTLPGLAFAVSVPVGLLIVALLVVNNLRDIEGDALVGKRTLAVLLGERATRLTYVGLLVGAFAVVAAVAIGATLGGTGAPRNPAGGAACAYGADRRPGTCADRGTAGNGAADPGHRDPAGRRSDAERMSVPPRTPRGTSGCRHAEEIRAAIDEIFSAGVRRGLLHNIVEDDVLDGRHITVLGQRAGELRLVLLPGAGDRPADEGGGPGRGRPVRHPVLLLAHLRLRAAVPGGRAGARRPLRPAGDRDPVHHDGPRRRDADR